VGNLGTVSLRVSSGTILPIFIEIGSYLTDKEQKISWHSFLRHGVEANRKTRKLSYRKDDRAMRPIYECCENFQESLTMPVATFPEIFNGIFFRLMLRIRVQNLKFVALPVPEIIGDTPKIGAVPGYAKLLFYPNF